MESIEADDAERARLLLDRDPDLRPRINEPIGPFDSPPLAGAQSRAMIDVLLAAGADINAKSQWWAGGFGYLHTADPELAAYAIKRGAVVDVHAAARLGHLDRLREFIERDPQSVHDRGEEMARLRSTSHAPSRSRRSCSTMAPTSTHSTSTTNPPPRSGCLATAWTWLATWCSGAARPTFCWRPRRAMSHGGQAPRRRPRLHPSLRH